MPDASIRAILGLDTTQWKASAKGAQSDLDGLNEKARLTAAAVALLEREMAGSKGTTEQIEKHRALRRELVQTEQQAKRTAKQLASIQGGDPGTGGRKPWEIAQDIIASRRARPGGGGEGVNRSGASEIGHSVRSFTDSVAAGQSPLTAASMEAPRLIQGLGGGVGEIAIVGTLAAVVTKIHSAVEEAHALEKALDAATAPLGGGGERFETIELLQKHIDGVKSSLAGIYEAEGTFTHTIGQMAEDAVTIFKRHGIKNVKPSDLAANKERAAVNAAQDQIRADVGAQAGKMDARNDLARRTMNEGKDAGTDAAIDERNGERIGDIRRAALPGGQSLVKASNEQANIEHEAANREQVAQQRAIKLEEHLTAIKRAELDVDIKSSEARLQAAKTALLYGPTKGNEHMQLEAAVKAAGEEVEEAKRTTTEKRDQLELETRIAQLRGSSDQVHAATLNLERESLEERKRTAKPDELPGINRDLARNQQQQDEQTRNEHLRAVDREEMEDRAHVGRGPTAQAALIDKELGRNDERRTLNDKENGGDPDTAARLDEQASQLKRMKEDIVFGATAAVTAATEQTNQMQLQMNGQTGLKTVEDARASSEAKILASQQAGTTELTAQLKKQGDLATLQAKAASSDTPADRARGANAMQTLQQKAQNYDDHGGTHDADKNGSATRDASGPRGSNIPMAGGWTGAIDSPLNATSGSFDSYFGGDNHMPGAEHMPDRGFQPPPVTGSGEGYGDSAAGVGSPSTSPFGMSDEGYGESSANMASPYEQNALMPAPEIQEPDAHNASTDFSPLLSAIQAQTQAIIDATTYAG